MSIRSDSRSNVVDPTSNVRGDSLVERGRGVVDKENREWDRPVKSCRKGRSLREIKWGRIRELDAGNSSRES